MEPCGSVAEVFPLRTTSTAGIAAGASIARIKNGTIGHWSGAISRHRESIHENPRVRVFSWAPYFAYFFEY
jgi:hypothetical protein